LNITIDEFKRTNCAKMYTVHRPCKTSDLLIALHVGLSCNPYIYQ